MTGRDPTASEVGYGKAMADAAWQQHRDLYHEAGKARDEAERAGWAWPEYVKADDDRHATHQAGEQYDRASTWVYLAERHPEDLKAGPPDKELEAR